MQLRNIDFLARFITSKLKDKPQPESDVCEKRTRKNRELP